MGLWKTIRSMFSGGGTRATGDNVRYLYVRLYQFPGRPTAEDEVVEVRLDLMNSLSMDDDGQYFTRKIVAGPRQFKQAEMTLYFDRNRQLIEHTVDGGELVDRQAYVDYLARQGETPPER
ncbi:MAG: hypothetical protein GYB66_10080 [Chloroflexi bacterium]|nr:hypothetical protein [Chloroflexota bacterium]